MKKLLIVILISTFSMIVNAQTNVNSNNAKVLTYAEKMPEPGYDIVNYLNDNLVYPDKALNGNIQGRVVLKFTVNEDGSITDCKVEKGIGGGCDEEAMKVVRAMPKWKPGQNNGVPVKVRYMLPVAFTIAVGEKIYSLVDNMPTPTFNYGKYIIENMQYPAAALKTGVEGTVFVKFVLNEEGKAEDVKTINSLMGGCNEEAIRLIKNMPAWLPGKQNDTPVKVWYNLPVTFKIKSGYVIPVDTALIKEVMPAPSFDLSNFLNFNLRYPEDARDSDIQGRVTVRFLVNKNGSIGSIHILKGVSKSINKEALRVIKGMPAWIPGLLKGNLTKVYFTLPINFQLEGPKGVFPQKKKVDRPDGYVFKMMYSEADKDPEPSYDLKKYFEENVKYTDSIKSHNYEGEFRVLFIINEDGSIGDAKADVDDEVCGCEAEAIRIVKEMPKWQSGLFNGKPVKVESAVSVPFYPAQYYNSFR